jgi:ribosome-associated toxin RatA of RatAB toxin-antitoxin module
MVEIRSLAAGFVMAAMVSAPLAARPTLDAGRMSELSRYQVLTFSDPFGGGFVRGKAIGVVDATPEEVFRVATDYAKYRDYMPRVVASTVKERRGTPTADEAVVEITAALKWPAGTTWVEAKYTTQQLAGDIYRVRFDMVRGNLKRYLGSLYIEPFAAGKASVTYELVAEPDTIAPKSAVNHGVVRSAGNFVHALRQRVNDLHRLGYLHPEPIAPAHDGRAPLGSPPAPPPTNDLKARR